MSPGHSGLAELHLSIAVIFSRISSDKELPFEYFCTKPRHLGNAQSMAAGSLHLEINAPSFIGKPVRNPLESAAPKSARVQNLPSTPQPSHKLAPDFGLFPWLWLGGAQPGFKGAGTNPGPKTP